MSLRVPIRRPMRLRVMASIASATLLGLALAGCIEPPPAAHQHPISVTVTDDRGLPLPGVGVALDGEPVGRTGGQGQVTFARLGVVGESHRVSVELPPGYRVTGEASAPIALRVGRDPATGELRPSPTALTFSAVDVRSQVLLYVAVQCPEPETPEHDALHPPCDGLAVHIGERDLGPVDGRGELWATARVELDRKVTVRLVGPAAARVEHPTADFVPVNEGDVLVMRRTLRGPRAPEAGEAIEVAAGESPLGALPERRAQRTAGPPARERPRARKPSARRERSPSRVSGRSTTRATPVGHGSRSRSRAREQAPAKREQAKQAKAPVVPPPSVVEEVAVDDAKHCARLHAEGRRLDGACRRHFESVGPDAGERFVDARYILFGDAYARRDWSAVVVHVDALFGVGRMRNDPELHYRRGVALNRLKRFPEAIKALDAATLHQRHWAAGKRGRRQLGIYEQLGFAHARLALAAGGPGARGQAIDAYRKAALLARQLGDTGASDRIGKRLAELEASG